MSLGAGSGGWPAGGPAADSDSAKGQAPNWNLAIPDIGVLPDIGSPTDTISDYVSRYRGLLLTRYRDMSHGTRYRVPISGTHPISGHHVTDIVIHIPDIGINIGYNIGCPDIGDIISRYRCQYRVPIWVSRYRGMIATDIVVNIGHDILSVLKSHFARSSGTDWQ